MPKFSLNDLRAIEAFEASECVEDQIALKLGFVRLSAGVAEGIVDEGGARRIDRARDRERAAHAQCRNAACFDFPGDQSHGLMADGSDRYQ